MKIKNPMLINIFLTLLFLAGCTTAGTQTQAPAATRPATETVEQTPAETAAIPAEAAEPQTLTVMAHDSFAVSDAVVAEFEKQNNARVNFLLSGDAASTLNRAILTKDAPVADVLYGFDNTFLSRALKEDIFIPYQSPWLANIPDEFKPDPENRVLPVDFGDVCINYDKAYFKEHNLKIPESLNDLLKPEYKGLLVVENPATSSPGLAFLLASIADFGVENYQDFWKSLRENGVVVVNDWSTAYYTNFSGSSGKGEQPMVVSYGSSPAAEVVFASTPITEAPTASIVARNTCFRQVEFVGILKGTSNQALAEKWVDFMLDKTFQEDIPMQMFVYPVNNQAKLPEEFVKYTQMPEEPASLPVDLIGENREQWIYDWDEVVLR